MRQMQPWARAARGDNDRITQSSARSQEISPAAAADADDHGDVGYAERQARLGRARDRLGLPALLGADAGIGALGVDQRDDRYAETVGHPHQPYRLAIAFGPRHAEIVLEPILG